MRTGGYRLRFLLVLLLVVTAAAVAMPMAANARQNRLAQDLAQRFAGTDVRDYRQWESQDRLSEEVFDVAGVFSDGASDSEDSVTVRYPASFFLARRCVLVTWSANRVDLARASGSTDCDELRQ